MKDKLEKYLKLLDEQNDKWQSEIRYHRDHKFDREADYLETKKKVLNEIRLDLRNIIHQDHIVTRIYVD
jgi:hypothetical protein